MFEYKAKNVFCIPNIRLIATLINNTFYGSFIINLQKQISQEMMTNL